MQTVNLLEFLNTTKFMFSLGYSSGSQELVDFFGIIDSDSQFTPKINAGILYLKEKSTDKYVIVDGLSRMLSLSLLLHAICECYKKTTPKNEKAIKIIRSKYLLTGSKSKLQLKPDDLELYTKIINGEKLSGKEKAKPMFLLLHKYWNKIKSEKIQASDIFAMLKKIFVVLVFVKNASERDLYIKLNEFKVLNQIDLIDDYLNDFGLLEKWDSLKKRCFLEKNDVNLFINDYLVTKISQEHYNPSKLYENFTNYFETMLQYQSKEVIYDNFEKSASLYFNILNINFDDDDFKNAFISIKKHMGSDTYAYILNIYEDYTNGNITKSIFLEILNTIDEYLKNRMSSGKNIEFNELIKYLNAFISCK